MSSWRIRPSGVNYWPEDVDYYLFIDENGDTNLKSISRKITNEQPLDPNETHFTITGCAISRDDFPKIRRRIIDLKATYWENGLFYYQKFSSHRKVCFHSSDIRNQRGPFAPNVINYDDFILDLSTFMERTPFVIFSATINKEAFVRKYTSPQHPYNLCLDFLLERFGKYFLKDSNKTGAIILEARGQKEDRSLLKHLTLKLQQGTMWASQNDLKNIKSVHFNTKWCTQDQELTSYLGLEIADLVSFPIHKLCKCGNKDRAFESFEQKFYGFPKYHGRGFKIFP